MINKSRKTWYFNMKLILGCRKVNIFRGASSKGWAESDPLVGICLTDLTKVSAFLNYENWYKNSISQLIYKSANSVERHDILIWNWYEIWYENYLAFQPDYIGEGIPQISMDFSQLFEVARGLGDGYGHFVNLIDGLKHARGVELFGSLVQKLHEAGLCKVLAGADALKVNKNNDILK